MTRNIRVGQQNVRTSFRAGDPARPPLVIANGIGASLELLQPFVDEVHPDIGVVRFDVPGVGGSPLPARPYRFAGLVRLLDRVLDQLGCDRVDMLGISWGGGLAQQFALYKPRRCRRLVLANTATGLLMIPAGARILKDMATPRRYRDPGYAVQIAANVYGGRLREDPELAHELLHKHLRLGPSRGYAYQLLAGLGWTSLPILPMIRQQTLILAGSDDPIIPLVNARIMQCLLPHADLLIYDDGHLGLLTRTRTRRDRLPQPGLAPMRCAPPVSSSRGTDRRLRTAWRGTARHTARRRVALAPRRWRPSDRVPPR